MLKDYTPQFRTILDKKTNKSYSSISFTTMQLPCFNEYRNLFYNLNVKIVPENIYDLLTPRGLAFCLKVILFIIWLLEVYLVYFHRGAAFNLVGCADLTENYYIYLSVPLVTYANADTEKFKILKENKGKCGIYRWINILNNKSYIGSSIDLRRRLKQYYNISYLERFSNMLIYKSLLKYGYSKFSLEILEYCDLSDVIKREQHYIDILKPEYNILKLAGSSFGYKHDEINLAKVRKHLALMNAKKSIKVEVTNIETNVTVEYASIRETAKELNTSKSTISRYIKKSKLFLGIYKLEANLPVSDIFNYINHPFSIKIEVTDLELNTNTIYDSMNAAARALNIKDGIIHSYVKRNQISPYKNRYIFKKI